MFPSALRKASAHGHLSDPRSRGVPERLTSRAGTEKKPGAKRAGDRQLA